MTEAVGQPNGPEKHLSGTGDLFSKFDPMIELREGLLASGVEDPFGLVMEQVISPTVAVCNGRETILLREPAPAVAWRPTDRK